jgi:dephospho-CoA kinase
MTMEQQAYRVGLTGGIASGKSAAATEFAALGVPVIDTDEIARRVTRAGSPALAEVVAAFGPEFLASDGTLDRRRLRAHVFADAAARRRLEAILHPRIEAATLAAAAAAGGPYQVIVVPLLVESGFARHVDRVLVVDAPEEAQRKRLLQRDDEDPQQVERILAAQAGRAARLARADDVISNDADLEHLHAQVRALHARYLEQARSRHET